MTPPPDANESVGFAESARIIFLSEIIKVSSSATVNVPATVKSPATERLLLTVVVPVFAAIWRFVALPPKLIVSAVVFNRGTVVALVSIPDTVTVSVKVLLPAID